MVLLLFTSSLFDQRRYLLSVRIWQMRFYEWKQTARDSHYLVSRPPQLI